MPKSAATILGFLLVASSIGFNTARYPIVWDTIGSTVVSQAAQPTAAPQPEKPEPSAPALPPAKPIEMQPAAEPATQIVGENSPPAEVKAASGDDPASADPESQRPLVPVTRVSLAGTSESRSAGSAGIRRLPPVTDATPVAASLNAPSSLNGSIPIYPSTGIE